MPLNSQPSYRPTSRQQHTSWGSAAAVWSEDLPVSSSCLLLVSDNVNTELESNCSETLKHGRVFLGVIKLII